jgi:hypothetical protein
MTPDDPSSSAPVLPAAPVPVRDRPPSLPRGTVPSSGGLWLRIFLFASVSIPLAVLVGRRWAQAFAGFQLFHPYAHQDLLAPEPSRPALVEAPVQEGPASSKQPRSVLFRLEAPKAKTVLLGGSFNNFDAGEHPMTRRSDGLWEAALDLVPGRYLYKFKTDGVWMLDPANPERTPAPREASVLEIQ